MVEDLVMISNHWFGSWPRLQLSYGACVSLVSEMKSMNQCFSHKYLVITNSALQSPREYFSSKDLEYKHGAKSELIYNLLSIHIIIIMMTSLPIATLSDQQRRLD